MTKKLLYKDLVLEAIFRIRRSYMHIEEMLEVMEIQDDPARMKSLWDIYEFEIDKLLVEVIPHQIDVYKKRKRGDLS